MIIMVYIQGQVNQIFQVLQDRLVSVLSKSSQMTTATVQILLPVLTYDGRQKFSQKLIPSFTSRKQD